MDPIFKNGEEKEALQLLRKEIKGEAELDSYDDTSLLRFLRARDLDIRKATTMLKTNVAVRSEWDVESLNKWDPPQDVINAFGLYSCGFDYESRPVYYSHVADWGSPRDLFDQGLEEDCLRYAAKSLEMVHQTLLKTRHQNFVCIVDFSGANYRRAIYEIQNYKGIQDLLWMFKEYEANYPETLNKAFVINSPSVFYWGYNLVKPLMSKHTLSKIEIYDNSEAKWLSAIRAYLPEGAIPKKLGGEAEMRNFY